jgi:catechol 2,3-dioxygenase-like lactoylglutathione lyase family enzyme
VLESGRLAARAFKAAGDSGPMVQRDSVLGKAQIIAFDVGDLARSRAFYVDGLKLQVAEEKPGEYVMVETGSCRLCLDQGDRKRPEGPEPARLLFQVPAIGAAKRALDRAGIKYDSLRGKTREYVEVRDPDGYVLVFAEEL